jgi:hypothetical protein
MTAESLQVMGLVRKTLLERIGPFALFPAVYQQVVTNNRPSL